MVTNDINVIKAQASTIKTFLKEKEINISHGSCLHLLSNINGFKNWNVFKAFLDENSGNTECDNELLSSLATSLLEKGVKKGLQKYRRGDEDRKVPQHY
jgi:hypothetical protein